LIILRRFFKSSTFLRLYPLVSSSAKSINRVYILENAKKPGVLVEVGFLSNPTERENLKKGRYQDKLAASIYYGILRYYSNEKEIIIPEHRRP